MTPREFILATLALGAFALLLGASWQDVTLTVSAWWAGMGLARWWQDMRGAE